MAMRKRPAAKVPGNEEAKPAAVSDADKAERAKLALRPSVNAAAVVSVYAKPFEIDDKDVSTLIDSLVLDTKDLLAGDMKRVESMLYGQAHSLQSIFMTLARRAEGQQYLKQWEAYLRMALKAQNQCRMTLETLATIKNPPVVFARQANINNGGQQQVNNGQLPEQRSAQASAPAPATNPKMAQTELLEASDGQWMDTGAAGTTGGAHPQLEAVGALNRPANR